jgi:large subunit ribosomal protein L21
MWAVVEIAKKQYKVSEGDILKVERLPAQKSIVFDKVLIYCKGKKVEIGTPYLSGIKVKGEILGEAKDKKVIVYKYKRRKKYRKKAGHRQIHTRLKISKISER